jgi:hypothetical protein
VGGLKAHELARLIGQDVGLPWLIPVALEVLRDTAPEEAAGGFYDDDLLGAVLTRDQDMWRKRQELAEDLREILGMLTDLGEWVEPDAKRFLAMFSE